MVVRFKDGATLSGFGDNFMPGETELLMQDLEERLHRLPLSDVKMVCFVKTFSSDPGETHRIPGRVLYQPVPGSKVRISFKDGEVLEGVSAVRTRPLKGFFLTPLNQNSNNIHVYVNMDEVVSFRFLD